MNLLCRWDDETEADYKSMRVFATRDAAAVGGFILYWLT